MFAHLDPGVEHVNYLKIMLEDTSNIVLSSNHLIMSGERMKATMARNIDVDHMLFTVNEEGVISSKKVIAIEEISRELLCICQCPSIFPWSFQSIGSKRGSSWPSTYESFAQIPREVG